MNKPIKSYQSIALDDLRKLRGYPISKLMRGRQKIPDVPGIYIWRYWPALADIDRAAFLNTLNKWKHTQPQFEEHLGNSRVAVSVRRTPFGNSNDKTAVLGFSETNPKAVALTKAVEEDADTRQVLAYTLETLLASAPPLYVGKADNLRSRLSDHFDEQSSTLLSSIKGARIELDDIYISFIADPISKTLPESITTAFEEIIQRITNPPLTKRYG